MAQKRIERTFFSVQKCRVRYQANAVAVIGVTGSVDRAQRLDRNPASVMPPVYGDAIPSAGQPVCDHDVFLLPGQKASEGRFQFFSLLSDLLVMNPIVSGGAHVRTGGHRSGFK